MIIHQRVFKPDSALETKHTNAVSIGLRKGNRINPAEAKHRWPKAKPAISVADSGFKVNP
jgi:hypothetical protein